MILIQLEHLIYITDVNVYKNIRIQFGKIDDLLGFIWIMNCICVLYMVQFSSVTQCLTLHDPHDTRPPCLSPIPRVYSNSSLLSRWCHPTISSSVIPFSSCPQSFPAWGSFQMSPFTSGGQSIGVSASTSSPSNEYSGLISCRTDQLDLLAVQGTLKRLLQHHSLKASILQRSAFFIVQSSHPYMTTGKTIALTRQTFVGKVMCLLFNMLSRLVITFLPRSKCHLISWLPSPPAVILETKNIKSVTVSIVSASTYHEVMGLDAMILVFWLLSFKPTFSFSSFTLLSAGYLFVLIDAPDCILRSDCIILTIWTREWVLRLIC